MPEVLAIKDLCFEIPGRGDVLVRGKLGPLDRVVLRGPSGCGKTTLLRTLAGLLRPRSGEVFLGGQSLLKLSPQEAGVGLVFQSGALFPHLNVFENVGFGLRHRKKFRAWSEMLRQERVEMFLTKLQLLPLASRNVATLSGGERQRVALLRTLIAEPQVLLMDEPLSAVDPELRSDLREWILSLIRQNPIPTLIVTHDQGDAQRLGTRIVEWKRDAKCLDL